MKKLDISALGRKNLKLLPNRVKVMQMQKRSIRQLEKQIDALKNRESKLNKRTASLEKRNIRLEELNEIKDEFIGIASHQLRTPATGVKQYINLLLDGFAEELTPNQRVFLERAHESNDRQLRIIDDLLRVAKVDSESFSLKLAETDIGKVVSTTINDLQGKLAERNQKIIFNKPKRKIEVVADSERIRMVLDNILDNAINYSHPKKTVTISIKNTADKVSIAISDQGVGIDSSDFSKLFQKFSRIPNPLSVEVGGSGLGLYWANKVIVMHNGSIDVKSTVGKGTTFTITLPKNKK